MGDRFNDVKIISPGNQLTASVKPDLGFGKLSLPKLPGQGAQTNLETEQWDKVRAAQKLYQESFQG